jgi:3-oxo-5-alpha-steroid 4-dehydrogenase 1
VEPSTLTSLAYVELGLAVPTVLALTFIAAPYGRYDREGFGPKWSVRVTWILMELPAVLAYAVAFLLAGPRSTLAWVLFGCWQLHYLHRSLVFPFRIPGAGTRTAPILVSLLGATFNVLNGTVNGGLAAQTTSSNPIGLAIGGGLFFAGLVVNVHHDNLLLAIRRVKRGPGDYAIPTGGLFRWVSCPNYLGEMIEWAGYALMAQSVGGLAFLVYTVANLGPRALAHHRWYREKFPEYPKERRALVPFVL